MLANNKKIKVCRNYACPECNALVNPSYFSPRLKHSSLIVKKYLFKLSEDKREVIETLVSFSCKKDHKNGKDQEFYILMQKNPEEYIAALGDSIFLFIQEPWVIRYISSIKEEVPLEKFLKKEIGDYNV